MEGNMVKTVVVKCVNGGLITIIAVKGDKFYIAECEGLGRYTQGKTWEELVKNVREGVELSLEDDGKPVNDIRTTILYND
jgi:predicted RNase H-like HicB family nuclease